MTAEALVQDALHSAWSSLAAAHAPPPDKHKAGNSDHSSLPRLLIGARKNVRVGGWLSVVVWVLFMLVLHCCTLAFSSCGEQGLLFIAVPGLLVVVASLVADHGI